MSGVRIVVSLPMRFFFGMFTVLSFIMIVQAAITLQIIEDKLLGSIIGMLLGIFFTPLELLKMLITGGNISFHGGIIELLEATGTWLFIFEIFRVARMKIFPMKSNAQASDIWDKYKTALKFVVAVFVFCVILNLIAGNYEGLVVYVLFNVFILPLSLSIPLYHWFEQNIFSRNIDSRGTENAPVGTVKN